MVTVTRNPKPPGETEASPSKQILAASKKEIEVTDAAGRRIKVRRLSPLERLRFLRIIGDEPKLYIANASIVAACAGIDGEPEPLPTSISQIEALVQRLGEEGFDAIVSAITSEGWLGGPPGDAREPPGKN